MIFPAHPPLSIRMHYGQFEKTLVEVFSIKESNLAAFRARLRHLRTLRVPKIPRRGSGNTAIYKTEDLLATFVALALQTLGSTPAISAEIANFAGQNFDKLKLQDEDIFLVIMNTSDERSSSKPGPIQRLVRAPPSVKNMFWTMNPLGGDIVAFIVVGATEAGRFATNAKVLASSVINLSERYRALPEEP